MKLTLKKILRYVETFVTVVFMVSPFCSLLLGNCAPPHFVEPTLFSLANSSDSDLSYIYTCHLIYKQALFSHMEGTVSSPFF